MPAHHQQQRDDQHCQRLKQDASHHCLVLLEARRAGAAFARFQLCLGCLQKGDDALDEHEQGRAHGGDEEHDEESVHATTLGAKQADANRKALCTQVFAQVGGLDALFAQIREGYAAGALGEALALRIRQQRVVAIERAWQAK